METHSRTKVQKIERWYKRIVSMVSQIVLIMLVSLIAQAEMIIEYPNDTDVTIQDAVNRAGCGGTVLLAAGTYTGSQLSTEPGPDYTEGHLLITCGARLIGAGIDETIIDGSNSPSASGVPVIGIGFHPFIIQPITENYELTNLTVKTLTTVTTSQAVAIGWANNVHVHYLKIEGFRTAVRADLSNSVEIDHIIAQGLGIATAPCIEFRERGVFLSSLPGGHMTGNSVHHNQLSNCSIGINLVNNSDASIHHNDIRNTGTGVQLRGVDDVDYHHNLTGLGTRGLNLLNANNSSYHHNTYCQNSIGVRYGLSGSPPLFLSPFFLFGFPPSSENVIHRETFLGNVVEDIDATADTNIGMGNTTQLEDSNQSTSDPNGSCPAP